MSAELLRRQRTPSSHNDLQGSRHGSPDIGSGQVRFDEHPTRSVVLLGLRVRKGGTGLSIRRHPQQVGFLFPHMRIAEMIVSYVSLCGRYAGCNFERGRVGQLTEMQRKTLVSKTSAGIEHSLCRGDGVS